MKTAWLVRHDGDVFEVWKIRVLKQTKCQCTYEIMTSGGRTAYPIRSKISSLGEKIFFSLKELKDFTIPLLEIRKKRYSELMDHVNSQFEKIQKMGED